MIDEDAMPSLSFALLLVLDAQHIHHLANALPFKVVRGFGARAVDAHGGRPTALHEPPGNEGERGDGIVYFIS